MGNLNRRRFLQLSAAGAAISMLKPLDVLAENKPESLRLETLKCDIAVVGAGPAGIPAAVAAAREGAKVILIEEDLTPGGAPVDMYVTFMCGEPRVGIYNEMIQQLNQRYSLTGKPVSNFGKYGWTGNYHWWLPSSFQMVVNNLISKEKNIMLLSGAAVVDTIVEAEGNRNKVKGVRILRSNNTLQDIEATITKDATGTGLVSERAGCNFMYGRESKSDYNESVGIDKGDKQPQHCTLMYITQRLRKDAEIPFDKIRHADFLEANYRWISIHDKMKDINKRDAGIFLRWGSSIVCENTLDTIAIAECHQEILKKLEPEFEALHDAGFGVYLPPKLGVRECRRIKGETVIRYDDIAQGIMPDDKIADARYSIDSWGLKDLPVHLKEVPPYGIPYRSVIPLGTEGLLLAGKIISGTHIAASSYRVQPICAAIGQAVGIAASMAVFNKTRIRDIEIKELQKNLDNKGLFDVYKNGKNR